MKTFALPAASRLKLTKTTPRKETHGDTLQQAISLRLRWETTNEHLGLLHPNLKDMLYWRPPALEAQQTADGIPETTPCLRVPTAGMPVKLDASFTGYTLKIDHGIDDSSALELYVCGLDKFAVDAKEGGTVLIDWSVASNKEITPELVGVLCSLEGNEVVATLTPPTVAAGDAIDGSVEAFKKDHPGARADGDDDTDPLDLFADAAQRDQHAGDFGQADGEDADRGDDEGGPVTSDEAGGGQPDDGASDSEGGETDSGGDAAAFEAGLQRELDAAGVKPKGRRGRRATAGAVE